MAINYEKIKQKMDQFKAANTRTSDYIWKPPTGKTTVRLVESKLNKDMPFIELYFHFNLGKKMPILSPISYGEPDPIVQFADKLESSGDKENFLLSKKLRPKLRVFAPIVVRGEESNGVKIWGFGTQVANEIMSYIIDPDYGNIADPISGRDLVVESISKEEAGNKFGKTNIRPKPNKTVLHADPAMVQKFLENQPDVNTLYQRHTYDELKAILKEYLDPTEDGVASAESTAPQEASTSVTGAQSDDVVAKSTEAFDDIFNS